MKDVAYLIIGADRDIRVVQRPPRLRSSEVAFKINLTYPDTWGKVIGSIDVTLPDTAPTATVDLTIMPEPGQPTMNLSES